MNAFMQRTLSPKLKESLEAIEKGPNGLAC